MSVVPEPSSASVGMRLATRLRRRLFTGGDAPPAIAPAGRISARERSLRVAALAVVLAPIGVVMSTTNDQPVQAPVPAAEVQTVVWAGRVFVDRAGIESFLRSRGVAYEVWAERHPVAASQLEDG